MNPEVLAVAIAVIVLAFVLGWVLKGWTIERAQCDYCERRKLPGSNCCYDHGQRVANVAAWLLEQTSRQSPA